MAIQPEITHGAADLPTRDKILLVDADGDGVGLLEAAAAQLGHTVVCVKTSREAFAELHRRLGDYVLIVIDVDPGAHGLALLEALTACAERPPLVILSALEEEYVKWIALERGAVASLGKPISANRLAATLGKVLEGRCPSCDAWGHLLVNCPSHKAEVKAATRGIARKLSPNQ